MREGPADEQLNMLMWTEIGSGAEGLADAVTNLSRAELERLLCLAIVEIGDLQDETEREVNRLARRLNRSRNRASRSAERPAGKSP